MTRSSLLRCADLARAAADTATITASFANVKPDQAHRFAIQTEEALTAALEALQEAQAVLTDARSPSGTVLEFAPGKAA